MTSEFNLLDEKWILVMDDNGKVIECNLKEVFEKAHEVRKLAGEIPTQDAAIFRFLLAVLYAVYQRVDENGNPCEMMTADDAFDRWGALWNKGRFDTKPIFDYLESYRDRFFLFHPTRPFYQIPLEKGTEYMSSKLNGELSESSNKPRLFSFISGVQRANMQFDEAARWLINLNAFDDTSSKPTVRGANLPSCGAGWVGKLGFIMVEGKNLFETLMLNLVLVSEDYEPFPAGVPTWEPENAKVEERTPISMPDSPVEILTLQSRRIHLVREGGSVTGYLLMGGDIVQKENAFIEQMTLWRQDSEGNIVPRRHDPARSMWRDYGPIMVKNMGSDKNHIPGVIRWMRDLEDEGFINQDSVTVATIGVKFADKDFFVENFSIDSMTVNSGLLANLNEGWNVRIADAVAVTDKCVSILWKFAGSLAEICGCDDNSKRTASERAKTAAYMELDRPFRRWLRRIDPSQDSIDDTMNAWLVDVERIVRSVARGILNESGERALTGKDGKTGFTAFRKLSYDLHVETHRNAEGGVENE